MRHVNMCVVPLYKIFYYLPHFSADDDVIFKGRRRALWDIFKDAALHIAFRHIAWFILPGSTVEIRALCPKYDPQVRNGHEKSTCDVSKSFSGAKIKNRNNQPQIPVEIPLGRSRHADGGRRSPLLPMVRSRKSCSVCHSTISHRNESMPTSEGM